ncbi:MAG: tetratricopeptide repeat protein [Gaiellaceae bacterium]
MARAAVKAKQAARAKAAPAKPQRGRRGHAGGGNPNQDLFFSRLRRRQKWVFLAVAIVFAATFVGVGVGSGNGNGLSQLYSGLFGGGSNAVSKATNEIKTNPRQGYRDLANAYVSQNDLPSAIKALQTYLAIRNTDAGLWTQLGGLEQQQGTTYAQQYQAALQAAQLQAPGLAFTPTGPLATQLGKNPINDYYAQQGSAQTSLYYQQATSSFSSALKDYRHAALIQPRNANLQYLISQVALYSNQNAVAIKALKRFVQIDPRSPQVGSAEQECKQLGGSCTPKHAKK